MSDGAAASELFVRRNLRHNLVTLGIDFGLFLVGMSFASQTTIMPAFLSHLGAPNLVIGAIPAVMTLGWLLPPLFVARYTESLPRKLPFVLRYTIWERVPFVVLALLAFQVATWAPSAALVATLAMLLVITGFGGLLMPAWMDIIGRLIPTTLRGRFFAAAGTVGNVGGLLGSGVTAYVLAAVAPPASYGICFLLGALFMALSYVALTLVREPASPPPPAPESGWRYLARLRTLVTQDANLSWYLVARLFAVAGTMAGGFYTVYALHAFAVPDWQVGVFTTVMLAGQITGNLVLGWLADRAGNRVAVVTGFAATVAANAVALLAPSVGTFAAVFALIGIYVASTNVSGLSMMLEFAPTAEARPTYIGLGNTVTAPVAFAAPLVGGLLADAAGYRAVFLAAAVFGCAGVGLLLTRVRDPRYQPAP